MRSILLIFACAILSLPGARARGEPLRSIAVMRELPAEQLAGKPKVEIECVVLTLVGANSQKMVVWQDGVGMYANATWGGGKKHMPTDHKISPGDRIRIKGTVWEGQIAPVIVPTDIEWIGTGGMPEARPANLVEMLSGRLASQWVRMEGVVQSVKPHPERQDEYWSLQIGTPHGRFALRLPREKDVDPSAWIDAVISIRGTCLHLFNQRGESMGARMLANSAADITVIKPSPGDPFATVLTPITRLQPFTPYEAMPHRRKISGMVTLCRPGSFLYLQDGERAVKVKTSDPTAFRPGDLVEAVGFVAQDSYYAEVCDAVLRKTGSAPPPQPLVISTKWPDLLRKRFNPPPVSDSNGRLVELTGVLELQGEDFDGRWLSVVRDGTAAKIRLPSDIGELPRRGSMVRFTGICELEYPAEELVETFTQPTGIVLLMRDSADLTIIKPASWWTLRRLWLVVATMSALLLGTLVWVRTLNRKVHQRSLALASEISNRQLAEARTEERTRLAEELHDTIAQGLTGVSLQLEAAGRAWEGHPEKLPRHLLLARQILGSSRDEIRRSLWNLRSGLLDSNDLLGSLEAIAANLSPDAQPEILCHCEGKIRPLPDSMSHALLRIAQEALSNAVNHASARHVDALVEFSENHVILTVRDDGRGFDLSDAMKLDPPHFGLQGMRGRTRRLNGEFHIESKPGTGTTVRATIPNPSQAEQKN